MCKDGGVEQSAPRSNTNLGCGLSRSFLTALVIRQGTFPQHPVTGLDPLTRLSCTPLLVTLAPCGYGQTLQPGGHQTIMASLDLPPNRTSLFLLPTCSSRTPLRRTSEAQKSVKGASRLLSTPSELMGGSHSTPVQALQDNRPAMSPRPDTHARGMCCSLLRYCRQRPAGAVLLQRRSSLYAGSTRSAQCALF